MSHLYNHHRYRLACLLALALATLSCAPPEMQKNDYFDAYETLDLSQHASYSSYAAVIKSYLRANYPGTNTQACVLGLTRGRRDTEMAWIIWRDGGRIIYWAAGENDLSLSTRNLSLNTDVVPSDEDVGSSTYMVSEPWVEALESRCHADGETVTMG